MLPWLFSVVIAFFVSLLFLLSHPAATKDTCIQFHKSVTDSIMESICSSAGYMRRHRRRGKEREMSLEFIREKKLRRRRLCLDNSNRQTRSYNIRRLILLFSVQTYMHIYLHTSHTGRQIYMQTHVHIHKQVPLIHSIIISFPTPVQSAHEKWITEYYDTFI